MKIAITGKSGSGKTTLATMMALTLSDKAYNVLAIDCDPDNNLLMGAFVVASGIYAVPGMVSSISKRPHAAILLTNSAENLLGAIITDAFCLLKEAGLTIIDHLDKIRKAIGT